MSSVRDPREIITPDAFTVAPELLGLPLARPARRAAAMLVDLVIVSLIIKAFGFVIFFIAAALLLFRVAKPAARGGAVRRGAAWLVRAWAVLMLAIFGALFAGRVEDFVSGPRSTTADGANPDPDPTPFVEPLARQAAGPEQDSHAPAPDAAALRGYLDASERGDTVQAAALLGAAQRALAGDRIERLEQAERELRERNRVLTADLERARQTRGLRRFVAGLADDLGLGFGWMAVYFTAFVVFWNGQTPGKRLLGIRIIRLDAKPLTWWLAFERFGGYAASFSTGLLGFAQIVWDRNRQGMHDKFIETVVIRENAGRAGVARNARSAVEGSRRISTSP
jgi:hypothetical protein